MQQVKLFKIIRMLKRRHDMTLAQFKGHWLDKYLSAQLRAMETGPLHKIVASFSTGEIAMGGAEAQFDGMATLYFDSLEQAHAALAGPMMGAMREEEKNFAESAPIQIVADEYLMSQKPFPVHKTSGQLKIIRTVYRRSDLSHQQFKDYWLYNHAKLEDRVVAESGVQRIIATFAVPEPGKAPDMDGMVELYFSSLEDIRSTFAGPIPGMMRADETNFVQMDAPAIRAVAEEYVLADRTVK